MTPTFAALAVAATPIAGLAPLAPRSFILARCFQTSSFGGFPYRVAR